MGSSDSDFGKIIEAAALAREVELHDLKAQPLQIPSFSEMYCSSYKEVHLDALQPQAFVKSLNLSGHELAVTQLHRELRSGRVRATCEEIHGFVENQVFRRSWAELQPWIWKFSMPTAPSDFWETGYFKIAIPATIGGSGTQGSLEMFDARFVWQFSRESTNPDLDSANLEKTPVGRADLEKWFAVFSEVHPTAVENLAIRSASAMFPDNHVPRQWVRDLRGPQKLGKPTKRHE